MESSKSSVIPTQNPLKIGIIGGTGREGRGLAIRWAMAGHTVCIGSRSAERAAESAREFSAEAGREIVGASNVDAAGFGDVTLLAVPYSAHAATLTECRDALAGRILIDITVPLAPPKVREVNLPAGAAAALEGQALVGDAVRVVATLHHVSSSHLSDLSHEWEADVFVCGNDEGARTIVAALVTDLGLSPIDAGVLKNAVALESLTPVLLHINRKYKVEGSGVRVTGIPR